MTITAFITNYLSSIIFSDNFFSKNPNVVIALAGNKSDMESKRQIEFEEVSAYAKENNLLHFETSAKTGANIKELFTEIATKIPKIDQPETRSAFPISPPRHRRRDPFACW